MTDTPVRIAVVIGSTRPGRRGPEVARWVAGAVERHPAAEVRIVDLADLGLPLLDEPRPAARSDDYVHEHTRAWARIVAEAHGFVVVTPEYNRSIPAALKNALDFLYREWHDKSLGIVGYGVDAGGARAAEALRPIAAELRLADVRDVVCLSLFDDVADGGEGRLRPRPFQEEALTRVVDGVVRWARALAALRAEEAADRLAGAGR